MNIIRILRNMYNLAPKEEAYILEYIRRQLFKGLKLKKQEDVENVIKIAFNTLHE